ncbi:hypothetical protein ACSDR0_49145 [Streptosporangium sp. G11]|uniref:hypothetical protein n=1 Tax=Streptosporangium sp. G11 TaxID=3436926 RepID=UPI003EB98935
MTPADVCDAVGEPVPEVAERAGRLVLKTLEQPGGLDTLASAHVPTTQLHLEPRVLFAPTTT